MDEFIGLVAVVMIFGMPMVIVWLVLRHKQMMALNNHPEVGDAEVESLSRIADILDQRVQVLERILDSEVPDWREQYERERMVAR